MDLSTFIVSVFTFIDDWFQQQSFRLRQRGPQPTLSDSEVLTIEVVGAFLGIRTEKSTFSYFRRHWKRYFPKLQQVHRTTYTRQSANLCQVKALLWAALLQEVAFDPAVTIIDSMPIPLCRYARGHRCRRLEGFATWGYDDVAKQKFFGIRLHLRLCWPGVITGVQLAPANVHELHVAEEMLAEDAGWVIADRNYWSPELALRLSEHDLILLAPFRSAKREKTPWPTRLKHMRYRIETVFGQLVERFGAKDVWARLSWHFANRCLRWVLSHTFAVFLCQQNGLPSLHFAHLIAD